MAETMKGFNIGLYVVFFVCIIVAEHGSVAKGNNFSSLKHIRTDTRNESKSKTIDNGFQETNSITDMNQDATEPISQTDNSETRVKRDVFMTDHGYGSRLQAGSNMAKGSMLGGLYGLHGPGKRGVSMDAYGLSENESVNEDSDDDYVGNQGEDIMVCLPLSKLRQSKLGQLQMAPRQLLSKRHTTDFGYGSLVEATGNVARSHDDSGIFGITGPGKRSIGARLFYKRGGLATDSGYGSRIQTGELIARDYDTLNNLYGNYGPGRRKRGDKVSTEKMDQLDDEFFGDEEVDEISSDKRGMSDLGYMSRIDAATRIARSKNAQNIFGSGGPGKR